VPLWLRYTLLTALLWGLWGFDSKLLVDRTSPYAGQILFTAGLAVPVSFVLLSKRRFAGERPRAGLAFAVLTGLLGGLGNLAFFAALERGSASVVVPLTSLSPLVTVLVGVAALKESMRPRQWFGVVLALLAIYLLSQ